MHWSWLVEPVADAPSPPSPEGFDILPVLELLGMVEREPRVG